MNNDVSFTIKKYIKRWTRSLSASLYDVYSRVLVMDKYEQWFVIGLLALTVLTIISPLMVLSPNDDASSTQFIFLIGRIQLLKTTLVVLVWLILTLSRHLNTKFKNYIIEYVWFDKNPYLLSFFLLFAVLSSVMSLGDINNVLSDYTTMLHMHTMYYVIQIILITLAGFCVYMLIHDSQWWFTGHVVGYNSKKSSFSSDDDMQGLFSELKD